MLLSPDLDDHLLEARHNGGGPKVSKVGHPIACAETEYAIAAALVHVRLHATAGCGVGGVQLGQSRCGKLGIDWRLDVTRRGSGGNVAFPPHCRLLVLLGLMGSVVLSVAGAFVLVLRACAADGPFPLDEISMQSTPLTSTREVSHSPPTRAARLLAPACQTSRVDPAPLCIRAILCCHEANWLRLGRGSMGGSCRGRRLIHERLMWAYTGVDCRRMRGEETAETVKRGTSGALG
jgi:hypothetical protein